ncbi:NEAT domain-containing protein [Lysinibacillus parviboronicapiens]|uniref:NEAT domain-containing protein n=1 Tax=Lysinibacillus parviboronicapiens TaxID=436516 RepID=UPI000D3C4E92|nr:NEAT domain-containing protein [Lysinibacillus parviboronicapiens]
MLKINRTNFLLLVFGAIFIAFLPQFIWMHVQAEESSIENGTYQVELSFPSIGGVEQSRFFGKEATLFVDNGHYTLSLAIENENSLTNLQIAQNEKTLPFNLKSTENLVQFDVIDLIQPIIVRGLMAVPLEEDNRTFTQELLIQEATLKAIETQREESIVENPIEENTTTNVIVGKEWTMNYVLLVDGKREPSMMNTYVNPVAKMIEKEEKVFAQMSILKSAWVTGLTVEQQGEQVEPKLISLIDNLRIIEFEMEDLKQPLRMWVKVDIPELDYHHQYFVNLELDQQQVAKFLHKPSEEQSPEQVITVKPPVIAKGHKPGELTAEPVMVSPQLAPSLGQPTPFIPNEGLLAFDRTLDANTEKDTEEEAKKAEVKEETATEKVEMNTTTTQQLAQLDKVKIALLIIICLLSGWLLVRRIKNSKKKQLNRNN